ncbi:hypothetical protein ACYJW8_11165 [Frateuria aurantia]
MNAPIPRMLALALLAVTPWIAMANPAEDPPAPSSSHAPSNRDLAESTCVIGEEAFVPGDYYYCLAGQSYGQKNYAQSRRFFTTAAGWASKPAQFMLGLMAFNGDHEPVNRPLGLAWLALAAERQQNRFTDALAKAKAMASPADWAAAQPILADLRPTYADAKAAPRAETRYQQGMQKLRQTEANAGAYCMEGMVPASQLSNMGDGSSISAASCPPVELVLQAIDHSAGQLFDGWTGHVETGPLEQLGSKARIN